MVKPTQRNQIRSVRFVCSFSTHATWNVMNFRCNVWTIGNFTMNDVRRWSTAWLQSIMLVFHHFNSNREINLDNDQQPIWNNRHTQQFVFLFSCCRIEIFFSWLFVLWWWSFNIFHIWSSKPWFVCLWKQHRQAVFLWFLDPWINKIAIKNE